MEWAKEQGYDEIASDGRDSLYVRDPEKRAIVFEFVADPSMITWLDSTIRRLSLMRRMIDPDTRAVVVVPGPLAPALTKRMLDSLQPPLELYVLVDGQLLLQEVP